MISVGMFFAFFVNDLFYQLSIYHVKQSHRFPLFFTSVPIPLAEGARNAVSLSMACCGVIRIGYSSFISILFSNSIPVSLSDCFTETKFLKILSLIYKWLSLPS